MVKKPLFVLTKPQHKMAASIEILANEYPHGFKFAIIMIGLCLSVLCIALDNTIIATAILHITDDFYTLRDVGWCGSAYLLPTCAFQLFYGKMYSKVQHQRSLLGCSTSIRGWIARLRARS